MSIYEEVRTKQELGEMLNIDPKAIQNYLDRKVWMLPPRVSQGGGVQGKLRTFPYFSMIHLAMAQSIIDMGVAQKTAFEVTKYAAHTGGDSFMGQPEREVGMPFEEKHGDTVLAITGSKDWDRPWRTWLGPWPQNSEGKYHEIRAALGGSGGSLAVGAVLMINMNRCFEEVCNGLGRDYRDVMEEAYADRLPDHGPEWPEAR